jgi:hypothetical protein
MNQAGGEERPSALNTEELLRRGEERLAASRRLLQQLAILLGPSDDGAAEATAPRAAPQNLDGTDVDGAESETENRV